MLSNFNLVSGSNFYPATKDVAKIDYTAVKNFVESGGLQRAWKKAKGWFRKRGSKEERQMLVLKLPLGGGEIQ